MQISCEAEVGSEYITLDSVAAQEKEQCYELNQKWQQAVEEKIMLILLKSIEN